MRIAILIALIAINTISTAEMVKIAIPDEKCGSFCFYWWPKLPNIDGWSQDIGHSYHYRANTQTPNGFTFANAESVIYAKAMYKPGMKSTKSLKQFIAEDHLEFLDAKIEQTLSLKSANNKVFLSYTFTPKIKGNWEQVSYGEEGEYYVVFTLSSRSKLGFDEALPIYVKFINQYDETPNKAN